MHEPSISIKKDFSASHPKAYIGFLQFQIIDKPQNLERLIYARERIISQLKDQYAEPSDLRADPVIQSYVKYYKTFKKSYHVLLQLESLLFKDREFHAPDPLLQIIFLTELKNKLLTAVHDAAALKYPLEIGVASGQEQYTLLNKSVTYLKQGDMVISDQKGVISSIIYGPDHRTRITPGTSRAMVAVYAPTGIDRQLVEAHFDDMISLANEASLNPIIVFKKILPD